MKPYIQKLISLFNPEHTTFIKHEIITFKFKGIRLKRKGFYLVWKDNVTKTTFDLTFEPVEYSNGDKWMICGDALRRLGFDGIVYAKSTKSAFTKLWGKKYKGQ